MPVRTGVAVESPQKAAIDGKSSRLPSPAVPLLNTAASLGFPKDALSAALLVFARFFSLSADKAFVGSLRREILDLLDNSSPENTEEKAVLEAKAMAAVIAADKGMLLSPVALERYARFLMHPAFSLMAKNQEGKETSSAKTAQASQKHLGNSMGKPLDRTRGDSREEIPDMDELRAIAEAQTQEDGFLDFFNCLPGKNGQYWLVFPFNVKVKGIELEVLMRVLSSERGTVPGRVSSTESGQIIADISGPKRQWRCFLKKSAGKFRADIQVYPEYSQTALNHLRKEAKRFLGKGGGSSWSKNIGNFSGFEEIIVRNGDRIPLWVEELWPDRLPFVDEEV